MSYVFADGLSGGTRVEIRVAKPKPRDKAFVDHAAQHFAQTIKAEDDVLRSRAYRHLIGTSRRRRHPSVGLSM